MKSGSKSIDTWFPFYLDKWMFGSTRHELVLQNSDGTITDLRGIWVDLLVLSKKDNGYIRANETTPYPLSQLAGMFCVPVDMLKQTIDLCIKYDKIREPKKGIYYVTSTDIYSLSRRHKYRMSQNSDATSQICDTESIFTDDDVEKVEAIPYKEIIEHLNSLRKSNRGFEYEGDKANKTRSLIDGLWKQGYRVDDFKTVHENKAGEWGSDSQFLRPITLYGSKFESYLKQGKGATFGKPFKGTVRGGNNSNRYQPESIRNGDKADPKGVLEL